MSLIITGALAVASVQLIRFAHTVQSTGSSVRLPALNQPIPAVHTQEVHLSSDDRMAPNYEGKYKLAKSEKFDEYMKALGVGLATRKIGIMTSPTLTVTQDGDHFVWKSDSTFKSQVVDFNIGKEYDFKTMDDRNVKCLVTWEGEKLKEVQKPLPGQDGKETTLMRELDADGNVLMTLTIDDIVCTRYYKRC
ncbi:fatty acid-binding protein, brain-like [Glandiceps talaboti]